MKKILSATFALMILAIFCLLSEGFDISDHTPSIPQKGIYSPCGNGACDRGKTEATCPADCFEKPKIKSNKLMLADYGGNELILDDFGEISEINETRRVNITLLIERLKDASINTFFFPVESQSLYDDFKSFLGPAELNDIDVYMLLVPPHEGCSRKPPHNCDFIAWAREGAQLSLTYSNLKGFIIDDFGQYMGKDDSESKNFFPKEYVAEFIYAAYEINPHFRFTPVLYYKDFFNVEEVLPYVPFMDGIIFPYLTYYPTGCDTGSIKELDPQITLFNEMYSGVLNKISIYYPEDTEVQAGNYASFTANLSSIPNPRNFKFTVASHRLDYYTYSSKDPGFRAIQLLINNKKVWEKDAADFDYGLPLTFNYDLSTYPSDSQITLRVYDKRSLNAFAMNFGIFPRGGDWSVSTMGPFEAKFIKLNDTQLDMNVMVYATAHSDCGDSTPEYVRDCTSIILKRAKRGDVNGVSMFLLEKEEDIGYGTKYYWVKKLYSAYNEGSGSESTLN